MTKKIAILHEWLSTNGGSEKVLSEIIKIYSNADIYCIVDFLNEEDRKEILGKKEVRTTFIQKLPFSKKNFRVYFPLLYSAVKTFSFKKYDIIITSSHAFGHSARTFKNNIHICYCHTPMRYIWDMRDLYMENNGFNKPFVSFFSRSYARILRKLDYKTAQNVNYFIANSHHIQNKIKKIYNRESIVIYPPVDVYKFKLQEKKSDYYITSSRFVSYKKNELIVEAFSKMLDKKLLIIGEGKYAKILKEKASANIKILKFQPFWKFHKLLRNSKAFVFAAEEDFGITLVEAQACGTPVIAFEKGGASEIVINNKTGILFKNQTIEDIVNAIEQFERLEETFRPFEIRKNAMRFNKERFHDEFDKFLKQNIYEN